MRDDAVLEPDEGVLSGWLKNSDTHEYKQLV